MNGAPADERVLVIEPDRVEQNYWLDLWRYRELLLILAWRDVAVRYKQTVVGIAWAVIRPLLTTAVFTIVFGRVAGLPSDGQVPYAALVLTGMLPWFLVSGIVGEASQSVVANANLIGKVYFPRLIVPLAASVVVAVDFLIALALSSLVLLVYGVVPGWRVVFLPMAVLAAILAGLGPAILLSALNVEYRDFRYVIPFLVQFGLYVSPVGFSSAVVPEGWRLLYYLNPAAGVIDLFRWCILGEASRLDGAGFALTLATIVLFGCGGVWYFRRTERRFADVI